MSAMERGLLDFALGVGAQGFRAEGLQRRGGGEALILPGCFRGLPKFRLTLKERQRLNSAWLQGLAEPCAPRTFLTLPLPPSATGGPGGRERRPWGEKRPQQDRKVKAHFWGRRLSAGGRHFEVREPLHFQSSLSSEAFLCPRWSRMP